MKINIRDKHRYFGVVIICISLIVACCFLFSGCSSGTNQTQKSTSNTTTTQQPSKSYDWSTDTNEEKRAVGQVTKAKVTKIVDGDTIYVDAYSERVRLIGVNCPEKNATGGSEATSFTANLIPVGNVVWLEKDVSETDKYGRPLRYVWLEDPGSYATEYDVRNKTLQGCLLYQKQATVATYKPDVKYDDWLRNVSKFTK